MASSESARKSAFIHHHSISWGRLEKSFVAEQIRNLASLPRAAMRAALQDLTHRASERLIGQEVAAFIQEALQVRGEEVSSALIKVEHVWSVLDLTLRRASRLAYEQAYGRPLKFDLNQRLTLAANEGQPAYSIVLRVRSALSW